MNKKTILLLAVLLFPSVLYIVLTTGRHNFIHLQYFGPREATKVIVDGKEKIDTIYHSIPSFKFINQSGDTVTGNTYKDKIYVADFFFTTCKGICKDMASQLLRVQEEFRNNDSVLILSHSVNPENDSVSVLAEYSKMLNADSKKWNFVTGDKKQIYDIARSGYFVTAMKGDGGADDFIHSEMFVLVDKEKHIRGFYDGTNPKEVDRLIDEIKVLIAEYMIHSKNKSSYE